MGWPTNCLPPPAKTRTLPLMRAIKLGPPPPSESVWVWIARVQWDACVSGSPLDTSRPEEEEEEAAASGRIHMQSRPATPVRPTSLWFALCESSGDSLYGSSRAGADDLRVRPARRDGCGRLLAGWLLSAGRLAPKKTGQGSIRLLSVAAPPPQTQCSLVEEP